MKMSRWRTGLAATGVGMTTTITAVSTVAMREATIPTKVTAVLLTVVDTTTVTGHTGHTDTVTAGLIAAMIMLQRSNFWIVALSLYAVDVCIDWLPHAR